MPITINFVSRHSDAYDLTDPNQAKKLRRILNANKRLAGGRSNGTQSKQVKLGYKGFDFLTK